MMEIAGFWRRLFALVLDVVLIGVFGLILGGLFTEEAVWLGAWGRWVGFGIALVYFGLMNSHVFDGKTFGKMVMGVRVVGTAGMPIPLWRSFVRYTVLGFPFFLNGAVLPTAMEGVVMHMLVAVIVFGGMFATIYLYWEDGTFTRGGADEFPTLNTKAWTFTPGGFGLASTLDDYIRFARILVGGGELEGVRILEPETIALMATDALSPQVTDRSWLPGKGQVGFGIDFAVRHSPPVDAEESSGAVGEFFWDGYANTLFWIDPRNDIAAVLFTQYVPPGGTGLHKAFRDAVYAHDVEASAAGKPPRAP